MRTYIVIFVLGLAIPVGQIFGMGRSDGDKEKVKEPLMKQEAAPAKPVPVKAKPVKPAPVEAKPVQPKLVQPKPAKAEPVEDKVIVTVNGVKIMQSRVDKKIRTAMEQVQASGRAIPPNAMDSMKARMQAGIVQQIIEKQLIDEKLKAENIKITDKQIDDKIAELAEQNNMSMDAPLYNLQPHPDFQNHPQALTLNH